MSREPNAASSSATALRELSGRLLARPAVGAAASSGIAYARLPRVSARRPTPAGPAPAALHAPPEALTGGGIPRWDPLLRFVCESSGSTRAFVTDPAGLLIASTDGLEVPEAEFLGARLMAALDRVKMLASGRAGPVLCAALEEGCISVFEVQTRDGLSVTIGLLGEAPHDLAACRAIRAALEA